MPAGGRTQLQPTGGSEGEIRSIRAYSGEPLRQIHWRLSARQRQWLVKVQAGSADTPLLVDPDQLPGATLEERLSGACWLVREGLRRQRPTGLRLGGRSFAAASGRSHLLRLLAELARHGTH
jgi:uncharacterized protein (DUF58 family)